MAPAVAPGGLERGRVIK